MTELILVSPPVISEGRSFYPLIRVSYMSYPSGGWISATPLAIIIEEERRWSFVALEPGIDETILLQARLIEFLT
ncbi:MAG TPA: hypothetical protein VN372_08830 [Methanospirillum sp.]|nr:hypothetical protein [Methanospirillum sp.]